VQAAGGGGLNFQQVGKWKMAAPKQQNGNNNGNHQQALGNKNVFNINQLISIKL